MAIRRIANLLCAAWAVLFWVRERAVDWATCDDAYYYFTIARNIVAGHGSTFDRLHPTNAFHSVWLVICMVPHALGLDDGQAIRALLTLQMAGVALALNIGLRILERRTSSKIAPLVLIALVLSPWGITAFANGTESTCSLVAFA